MSKVTRIEASVLTVPNKKKLRVAAYCRVSTGSEEQLESLSAQKEHYEKYIKTNPEWEFAGLYYDEGVTGTKKDNRKGLQSMLTACELGQIDFIITKSISRLARNTIDCLEMVRRLIDLGIFLYFEKENINTQSMESELILTILSSMAQDESASISQNNKWAIRARYKNGTYKTSYPPYGYRNVKGEMIIVPEEAEVVRGIFKDTLSGKGSYTIARELNERKAPTKRCGKWTGTSVRGMISNEKYTGDILFQKTYTDSGFNRHTNHGELEQYFVSNHHKAIISHEDFDAAQAVVRQRGKEHNVDKDNKKYLNRYVMSGKIICGKCGGKLKRRTHYKASASYIAWTCSTHIEHKDECDMKYITEASIQKAFVMMLNKLKFGYKKVLKPYQNGLLAMSGNSNIEAIADLAARSERNADRKRVITELVGKGFLDAALFSKEMSDISAEAEQLKQEKKRLENPMVGHHTHLSELEVLMHFLFREPEITNFSDELFEKFTDHVIVYSREEIGFCLKCGITLRERLVE